MTLVFDVLHNIDLIGLPIVLIYIGSGVTSSHRVQLRENLSKHLFQATISNSRSLLSF